MYAIIREGNGKFYTSMVFGYYKSSNDSDYKNRFWIVLNKAKTALVKQHVLQQNTKYLIPMVLITDADESGWNKISENEESVNFLHTGELLSMIDSNTVPSELTKNASRWIVHISLNLSVLSTQPMIFVTWNGFPVDFTMHLSQRKKNAKIPSTFFLTELGDVRSRFGLRVIFPMIPQAEILKNLIRIGWEALCRLKMDLYI